MRSGREVLRVDLGVLRPLLGELILGEAGIDRAGLYAGVAVDALIGIDVELLDGVVIGLVGGRVDAVNRTNLHARVVLLPDARLCDDVGQFGRSFLVLSANPAGRPGERRILRNLVRVILLTGATGTVGKALLPLLVERGENIRALVRDPRGLGRHRVDVQITLGNLGEMGDARTRRQALRGVKTVIHLAAAIRDQPSARVEELNGLATARLLRAAEQMAVERFIFFSAIGATDFQRTRFFRAKALAEDAVAASELPSTVFAPSIVYDREDPWVTLMRRFALLPVLPLVGNGDAEFEPIWARDVARCVIAELERGGDGDRRYELAGPERLTYEEMARVIAWSIDRRRRTLHVPANLVRLGLNGVRRVVGDAAFATWEEAELLEVPMVSERGTADAKSLGVEPKRMADVLAGAAKGPA